MEQEEQKVAPLIKEPILKKFSVSGKKDNLILAGIAILVVLVGIGTGWLISGRSKSTISPTGETKLFGSLKEAGSSDEKAFPDSAEGNLEAGGINGEGTHKLVREGGESQTVYLISTVIDLESFVGKKVKVWGKTESAKRAGWLMDVGKVKVID